MNAASAGGNGGGGGALASVVPSRAKPRVLAQQTTAQRGESDAKRRTPRRNGGFGHRSATTQFRGRGSAAP